MRGKISIVMPVKNAEAYLVECINSIIEQTYIDWELLAVNDNSTDNTATILKRFEQQDIRIHSFNSKGVGIIDALNLAYKHAKGEFIHRMDADDVMSKNKLEALLTVLTQNGKGSLATAKVKYFAKNGVGAGYKNYEAWLNALCENNSHWKEIYKECVVASPVWLIHKEDFEKCGAFNSSIYPEDYDLVFRFYKHGLKVFSSEEVVHFWRDYQERTSRNDDHYKSNYYFALKLKYFLEIDKQPNKNIVVWGAGQKGKLLAKLLQERRQDFQWVCDNPNKEGKEIYEQIMQSYKALVENNSCQILITVAQKGAKKEIISFLNKLGLKEQYDYYFFS